MSKKNKIIIILTILIVATTGLVLFFTNEDSKTSLTVTQKRWIENNKNKVIDFASLNDIPIISNNGNGIFFDFLNSLEKDTGLEFNKISYKNDKDISANYALKKVEKVGSNDLTIYQDNYVLITSKKTSYTETSEIKDLTLGALKNDLDKVDTYLTGASNLNYKSYSTNDELITALKNKEVSAIVLPKTEYLEEILNNKLHIAYNISEYKINYVITLNGEDKLNKIIAKYFKKWQENKYENSFSKNFADNYFTYKKISEESQTELKSRRYTYGFVTNAPYDITINGSLKGFNHGLINRFAKTASIEIDYKQYSSFASLLKDFNENKVDITLNNFSNNDYKMDVYKTVSVYDSKVAVIADNKTDLVVNNISSLTGQSVKTIKDSKINKYLKKYKVKLTVYDNVKDLISHLNKNDVAVIDLYTYDYYVRFELKSYKNLKTLDINDNYGFVSRNIISTKNLNEFFNFYLTFINTEEVINDSYNNLLLSNNSNKNLQLILSCVLLILIAIIIIITKFILGKKKDINSKLSKTDKLRYIDSLTSLKNRNYLNDNINKWDNSEVYPQAVIIIDLNNIAYINDNFGHNEGDKVIVEGAGILINNQLSDSELLRTNGNEFLVFAVGHDEKSIVTFIRKLNKEFKDLSHGFGAAIGYSMVNDEIKTIDDAINEATLDMRSNKNEIRS